MVSANLELPVYPSSPLFLPPSFFLAEVGFLVCDADAKDREAMMVQLWRAGGWTGLQPISTFAITLKCKWKYKRVQHSLLLSISGLHFDLANDCSLILLLVFRGRLWRINNTKHLQKNLHPGQWSFQALGSKAVVRSINNPKTSILLKKKQTFFLFQ